VCCAPHLAGGDHSSSPTLKGQPAKPANRVQHSKGEERKTSKQGTTFEDNGKQNQLTGYIIPRGQPANRPKQARSLDNPQRD